MNFENIIIEGNGIGSTYADIQNKKIDIEYFNESLLNKMYFLIKSTNYKEFKTRLRGYLII